MLCVPRKVSPLGAAVFFMTQEKRARCVFYFFFFNIFHCAELPLSTRCVLNSKCILQVQLAAGAITTKNLLIVVQVQLRPQTLPWQTMRKYVKCKCISVEFMSCFKAQITRNTAAHQM